MMNKNDVRNTELDEVKAYQYLELREALKKKVSIYVLLAVVGGAIIGIKYGPVMFFVGGISVASLFYIPFRARQEFGLGIVGMIVVFCIVISLIGVLFGANDSLGVLVLILIPIADILVSLFRMRKAK